MFGKKLISTTLVMVMVFSSFLPVFNQKNRAEAFLGIGDFGFDIEDVVKFALDAVAVPIAQLMVDDMVRSTIEWANTGFEGGPAYVTNPGTYFENAADNAVGSLLESSDLDFLCSPFRDAVRVSLTSYYYQPQQEYYQCSLSEAVANIEDFYQSFDNGGWDAWFQMTQVPTNNPYGAFLTAQLDLNSRISETDKLKQAEYQINQGFKSLTSCRATNPSSEVLAILDKVGLDIVTIPESDLNAAGKEALEIILEGKPYKLSEPPGACIEEGAIKTAGATIKSQLDRVLPSGLERLVNADQMSELVGAFASGLLQRYVFGNKGLFSDSNEQYAARREVRDVDNDGVADGYDTDADGQLDICHHGLKPKPENVNQTDWRPNNNSCITSSQATNSPFFGRICESTGNLTRELEKYTDFMTRNNFGLKGNGDFDKKYMGAILDRTSSVSGFVDEMISTIRRYESPKYDDAVFALGGYQKQINNITLSLAKDNDMHGDSLQDSDNGERNVLVSNTQKLISYLERFQAAIGQCDNPDADAIGNIPPPDLVITDKGSSNDTIQGSSALSCSANTTSANVGEIVTWTAQTTLSSPTFTWIGDSIPKNGNPITTSYSSVGVKNAAVSVTGFDSNNESVTITNFCDNAVNVFSGNEQ